MKVTHKKTIKGTDLFLKHLDTDKQMSNSWLK